MDKHQLETELLQSELNAAMSFNYSRIAHVMQCYKFIQMHEDIVRRRSPDMSLEEITAFYYNEGVDRLFKDQFEHRTSEDPIQGLLLQINDKNREYLSRLRPNLKKEKCGTFCTLPVIRVQDIGVNELPFLIGEMSYIIDGIDDSDFFVAGGQAIHHLQLPKKDQILPANSILAAYNSKLYAELTLFFCAHTVFHPKEDDPRLDNWDKYDAMAASISMNTILKETLKNSVGLCRTAENRIKRVYVNQYMVIGKRIYSEYGEPGIIAGYNLMPTLELNQ